MSTQTTNYKFIKPELSDPADITSMNENWDKIDEVLKTQADKDHTHTTSQITDFPTSMPSSDVPDWAKQPNKPTYTPSEVGSAPAYTYSTIDLTAGTSTLETGKLYIVYE